jgi:hypothetical protein
MSMAFVVREQSVPSPSSRTCNSALCGWFVVPVHCFYQDPANNCRIADHSLRMQN